MGRLGRGHPFLVLWLCGSFIAEPARSADCNGNGVADESDLRPTRFGFRTSRVLTVGGPPRAATAADLDGDGHPDIATANYGHYSDPGNTASVLWNRGDGTFGLPTVLTGGNSPDLLAGDPRGFKIHFLTNTTVPQASLDANANSIPDECERPAFHRGDPDGDGKTDVSDAVALVGLLFFAGEPPGCRESADATNDGLLDISDPVALLGYLYLAGPPPASPGPPGGTCGTDPDPPGSPGDLGCGSYEPCVFPREA